MSVIIAEPGKVFKRSHDSFIMGREIHLGLDFSTGESRVDQPYYYEQVDDPELADGAFDPNGVVYFRVVEVPGVPQEVTAWRLRSVARLHNRLDDIYAVFSQLPEKERILAEEGFKDAHIRRTDAIVELVRQALGMTHEDMDNWFIMAAHLLDPQ